MKKILGILSIAIMAMCFTGCSKNTPEGTADRYISAMCKGDVKKMLKETDLSEKEQEEQAALFGDKVKKQAEEIDSYEITETKMADDGETAVVKYTLKYKNGKEDKDEIPVKKVDGKWRVGN